MTDKLKLFLNYYINELLLDRQYSIVFKLSSAQWAHATGSCNDGYAIAIEQNVQWTVKYIMI